MSLWPLVWGLSFPKIKILSGGISDRKAPGSHQQRRCLYTVGFSNACWDLYQPCRRQSQDRIPGQDMTIKGHSFLWSLGSSVSALCCSAWSTVTPAVCCPSSNPAISGLHAQASCSSSPSPLGPGCDHHGHWSLTKSSVNDDFAFFSPCSHNPSAAEVYQSDLCWFHISCPLSSLCLEGS